MSSLGSQVSELKVWFEKKRLFFPVVLKQRTCCYDAFAVRLPFGPEGNELGVWGATKIILIMRKNVAKKNTPKHDG